MPTILHSVGVDARSVLSCQLSMSCALAAIEVDVFEVESVDMARDVTEKCKADIYTEIGSAASHHCNTHRRHWKDVSTRNEASGLRGLLTPLSCYLQRMVMITMRRAGAASDILRMVGSGGRFESLG